MKVRLSLEGTAPLLMHSARGVDPLDPVVKQIKAITAKRKKTEDDMEVIARLEFEVSMYFLDSIGPFIPGVNVEKCLVEGGRITKSGKNVERGLFVLDNACPLLYTGPRDIEGLWSAANGEFRSMMAVGVGGRKIMRCRPIFHDWSVECEAELDTTVLNIGELEQIATHAGSMVGLGDFRPRYGRFLTKVEPL
jgi:hypothetical protein